jgi:ABC-type antimicrobial peptide transport system permease subunit
MSEFFRRIYYLLNRRRLERELANDIDVHREMLSGEARKDFGNATLAWPWLRFSPASCGNFLYGLSHLDPLSYLAATALLSVVGGLAALMPARRALKVDPIEALRCE